MVSWVSGAPQAFVKRWSAGLPFVSHGRARHCDRRACHRYRDRLGTVDLIPDPGLEKLELVKGRAMDPVLPAAAGLAGDRGGAARRRETHRARPLTRAGAVAGRKP